MEVEAIGTAATLVKVPVRIAIDGAAPAEVVRQTTDAVAAVAVAAEDIKVTCLSRLSKSHDSFLGRGGGDSYRSDSDRGTYHWKHTSLSHVTIAFSYRWLIVSR